MAANALTAAIDAEAAESIVYGRPEISATIPADAAKVSFTGFDTGNVKS